MRKDKKMDISRLLADLYARRDKLLHIIDQVEKLQQLSGSVSIPSISDAKRRGRKSMGFEERQQVSKRMKKYWALRRVRR